MSDPQPDPIDKAIEEEAPIREKLAQAKRRIDKCDRRVLDGKMAEALQECKAAKNIIEDCAVEIERHRRKHGELEGR